MGKDSPWMPVGEMGEEETVVVAEEEKEEESPPSSRKKKKKKVSTTPPIQAATQKEEDTQLGPSIASSTEEATMIGDERDGRRTSSSLAATTKKRNNKSKSGDCGKKKSSSKEEDDCSSPSPPAAYSMPSDRTPQKNRNYSSSVVNKRAVRVVPHTHSSSSTAHQKVMVATAAATRRPRPNNSNGNDNIHHRHQESLSISGGLPLQSNKEQQQSSLERPIRSPNDGAAANTVGAGGKNNNAARQYSSNNAHSYPRHDSNNEVRIPQSSGGRRRQQQLPNNNNKTMNSRQGNAADALPAITTPREKQQRQHTATIAPGTATSATSVVHSASQINKAAAGADALISPGKTNPPIMDHVRHVNAQQHPKIGTKGGGAANTKYNLKPPSATLVKPNDGASMLAPAAESMSSAKRDRYYQSLASKGGTADGGGHHHHHHGIVRIRTKNHRIVRIRNKYGSGSSDDDDDSMAGVASVVSNVSNATTKSTSVVGAFTATPLEPPPEAPATSSSSSSLSSLRHNRYNEVMAAKGGRRPIVTTMAGANPPSSSDTAAAAATATSTDALISSTSDDVSMGTQGTEAALVAPAPTNLSRGSYLPTATVQPGAVSVDDGRDHRGAAAFEASAAPEMDVPSVASAAPAAPIVHAAAAAVEEANNHPFSVLSARLVEERDDDDQSIERRVDDRVNARLAEHQNNLVVADVVADDNRRQRGNRGDSRSPAIAAAVGPPWKMLVMYCLAVLVPVALASIVVGVVVARGSATGARGSGGTGAVASDSTATLDAVSNGGTTVSETTRTTMAPTTQAPTVVTSEQPSADPPSTFPSELPTDLSGQSSSSSSSGSGFVIGTTDPWLFWPPTTPPNDFPAAVPPPGSLPVIIPDAPGSCTSGHYYFTYWDDYGQLGMIGVTDVANNGIPRGFSVLSCNMFYFTFDRDGTPYGRCRADDFFPNPSLVTVDLSSGATTEIAASSDNDLLLAYNPADDHLYSVCFNGQRYSLIKIDKNDGTIAVVGGPSSLLESSLNSLAINTDGQAYGSSGTSLYHVNLTDGTSTLLRGPPPVIGTSALLGFRGTVLYGIGLDQLFQISLFSLNVEGTTFTTATASSTTIDLGDEIPQVADIMDGGFCP